MSEAVEKPQSRLDIQENQFEESCKPQSFLDMPESQREEYFKRLSMGGKPMLSLSMLLFDCRKACSEQDKGVEK